MGRPRFCRYCGMSVSLVTHSAKSVENGVCNNCFSSKELKDTVTLYLVIFTVLHAAALSTMFI